MSEWETERIGRHDVSIWSHLPKPRFITETDHPLIRAAYDERCRSLGVPMLNIAQRVQFDLEQVDKFGTDGMPFAVRDRMRDKLYTDTALGLQLSAKK